MDELCLFESSLAEVAANFASTEDADNYGSVKPISIALN